MMTNTWNWFLEGHCNTHHRDLLWKICLLLFFNYSISRLPKDISFYRYFLRSGLWAWWAKLACQVMLTIRGRLITPFVLGSMSVGLNILIRHSFMDLWVWITALVPWTQLLPLHPSPPTHPRTQTHTPPYQEHPLQIKMKMVAVLQDPQPPRKKNNIK